MDPCNVFLVDKNGGKRTYQANLNNKLKKFLEAVEILTGIKNSSISLGDQIYGQDYSEHTLRQLGFRQGIDVELMSRFN